MTELDPKQSKELLKAKENGKISNLSQNNSRALKRKNDDWPYKHIRFNEKVAVYEVPSYDESRFVSYDYHEFPGCKRTSCCSVQ